MVSFADRLLHRSPLTVSAEAEGMAEDEFVKDAFAPSESDLDMRRMLALVYAATEDENIVRVFAEKMFKPMKEVARDAKGDVLYVVSDKGKRVLDEDGLPVPRWVHYNSVDSRYAALYNLMSRVARLSLIDALDARIYELESRIIVKRMKLDIDREVIDMGEFLFLDSVLMIVKTLLNDARNGKLRVLATSHSEKVHSLSMSPNGNGGKRRFF